MEELLTKHENVLEKKSDKDGKEKIVCKLTQHEMESKVDVVEQYIHSKKFKKELEWYTFDYSKYQPFIVEHKSNRKRLYCNVTNTILNKIPTQIERHVNGRKFKRLKANVTTTTTDTPTVRVSC